MGPSSEAPVDGAVTPPPLIPDASQEAEARERSTAAKQALEPTTRASEHKRDNIVFDDDIVELVIPLSVPSEASRKIIKHLSDLKKNRQIKILNLKNIRGQGIRVTLLLRHHGALLSVINILNEVPEASLLSSKIENMRN
jgi:hypothetical protein